jgi:hypothetical protein
MYAEPFLSTIPTMKFKKYLRQALKDALPKMGIESSMPSAFAAAGAPIQILSATLERSVYAKMNGTSF